MILNLSNMSYHGKPPSILIKVRYLQNFPQDFLQNSSSLWTGPKGSTDGAEGCILQELEKAREAGYFSSSKIKPKSKLNFSPNPNHTRLDWGWGIKHNIIWGMFVNDTMQSKPQICLFAVHQTSHTAWKATLFYLNMLPP